MLQKQQQEDSKGRSEGNGSGEKRRKHPSFRRFNENIITDPGYVDIFPASRIPKQLHHLVKPIYRSTPSASRESLNSRGANMTEKGFRILTEPSNLSSVLQWALDSEVGFHLHACTLAAALSQEREMLIRELGLKIIISGARWR